MLAISFLLSIVASSSNSFYNLDPSQEPVSDVSIPIESGSIDTGSSF